jgi:hypothetical protein
MLLPSISNRQLPEFNKSLDQWVCDTIAGRKSSGLAQELSRAQEAISRSSKDQVSRSACENQRIDSGRQKMTLKRNDAGKMTGAIVEQLSAV